MPRFHVCQEWMNEEEFFEAATDIEAYDARRAAEVYTEVHHADLDYRKEVRIRVVPFGEPFSRAKIFDVSVASIPEATARERT